MEYLIIATIMIYVIGIVAGRQIAEGSSDPYAAAWVWSFLFGWFYFLYKGAYLLAFSVLAFTIVTFGFGGYLVPFFARKMMHWNARRRGGAVAA